MSTAWLPIPPATTSEATGCQAAALVTSTGGLPERIDSEEFHALLAALQGEAGATCHSPSIHDRSEQGVEPKSSDGENPRAATRIAQKEEGPADEEQAVRTPAESIIFCLAPVLPHEQKVFSVATPASKDQPQEREVEAAVAPQSKNTEAPIPELSESPAARASGEAKAIEVSVDDEVPVTSQPVDVEPSARTEEPVVVTGRMVEQATPRLEAARHEAPAPERVSLRSEVTATVARDTEKTAPQVERSHLLDTPIREASGDPNLQSPDRKPNAPARIDKVVNQSNTRTGGPEPMTAVERSSPEPAQSAEAVAISNEPNPARRDASACDDGERGRDQDRALVQRESAELRPQLTVVPAGSDRRPNATVRDAPEIPAARPVTVAGEVETASEAGPKPALKDLAVRVPGTSGSSVDLQFVESRGVVNLTMRTTDERIAAALRSDLPHLENDLELRGWRAEMRPAAAAPAAEVREAVRAADAVAADRQALRWSTAPAMRTEEAGMQSGGGRDPRHGAREMNEQQEEFLSLTALRRLAVKGERA